MNTKTTESIIQFLGFGLLLAGVKLVYSFFDAYNILDAIVFFSAGMLLGAKLPSNRWFLGLVTALPTFILCLYFVWLNGFDSIISGVGTSFAISLIVVPAATGIGLFIKAKKNR